MRAPTMTLARRNTPTRRRTASQRTRKVLLPPLLEPLDLHILRPSNMRRLRCIRIVRPLRLRAIAEEATSNSAMDRKTQEGLSSLVLMDKFDGSVGVTAFDLLKAILSVGSAEVTLQSVQDLLAWFTFVNRPCKITLWLPSTLVSETLQAELTYFWDNSLMDWRQS